MEERSNFYGFDGLDSTEGYYNRSKKKTSKELSNVMNKNDETDKLWKKLSEKLDDEVFFLVVKNLYQYEDEILCYLLECLISAKNKSKDDFDEVLEILREEKVITVFNSCAQTRRNSTVALLVGLIMEEEIKGFRRALDDIEKEDYINRAL